MKTLSLFRYLFLKIRQIMKIKLFILDSNILKFSIHSRQSIGCQTVNRFIKILSRYFELSPCRRGSNDTFTSKPSEDCRFMCMTSLKINMM